MDKQKQIEGMAKIILEKAFENYETSGSVEIDTEVRQTCYCAFLVYCEALYNAGCRILTENAVVLTREEFDKLGLALETVQEYETENGQLKLVKERKTVRKDERAFVDLLNQETRELQISQRIRKETAEKFAERAKEEAFTVFMGEPIIRASKIDEICKEITEVQHG